MKQTKEQRKEYRRKWRAENLEKSREYNKKFRENNPEYHKKWREDNPEKWRESYRKAHVKWAANNPEKARESYRKASRKWRENNPEKARELDIKSGRNRKENNPEYYNKWRKAKRKTDPNFRLHCNMRSAMSNALAGRSKSASTMKIIGCSVEEFFEHLESCVKWEPWMTRERYGKGGWDVDHIIAIEKWDKNCPLQFALCWEKSNLQPMEHIKNIKKGAK